MTARRQIEVFDTRSGMGGSFTVSVTRDLDGGAVEVRVWYGRATTNGWEPWPEWDGYTFQTTRERLTSPRTINLFK